MTFHIITLGCKVNAYESEIMREKLESAGYSYSEEGQADIVIVNTCSVTNTADKKSFKMVRSVKRKSPKAILVVAGCSSENKEEQYKNMDIDILIGNKDKSLIVSLLNEFLQSRQKVVRFYHTRKMPFEDMTVHRFTKHTRAFLKIQDGCNNFCSYCIIPYVRGDVRFKDFDTALKEANILVQNGHKEIVLTGIHTGSYGHGCGYDLADLIHEMSKIEGLERIRISSIEITELDDKFMEELHTNKKICSHLHIPLQAGSDEVLKLMNRKYDLNYFEQKLKQIRNIRPDISITTDIIVGHPMETDLLFQQTLHTAKRFLFSKIHAFPYSPREGTKAAFMEGQISESEKRARNQELVALSNHLENLYASSFLGKTLEVLIEEVGDDYAVGHTSNYLKVQCPSCCEKNRCYEITITNIKEDMLEGNLKSKVLN